MHLTAMVVINALMKAIHSHHWVSDTLQEHMQLTYGLVLVQTAPFEEYTMSSKTLDSITS